MVFLNHSYGLLYVRSNALLAIFSNEDFFFNTKPKFKFFVNLNVYISIIELPCSGLNVSHIFLGKLERILF